MRDDLFLLAGLGFLVGGIAWLIWDECDRNGRARYNAGRRDGLLEAEHLASEYFRRRQVNAGAAEDPEPVHRFRHFAQGCDGQVLIAADGPVAKVFMVGLDMVRRAEVASKAAAGSPPARPAKKKGRK